VVLRVEEGRLLDTDYVVHFPIPMKEAWDNVIYTCSVMLLFRDEAQVDGWTRRHRVERGDVQPILNVWEFAKVWYGRHLNPDWKKWTVEEADEIFKRFGLTHKIWQLTVSGEKF